VGCFALFAFSAAATAAALAIGLASELRTIDPHRAVTSAEVTVAAHVFETLVTLDAASKPLPALASEWVREDERNLAGHASLPREIP
jgi:ABC-type oligopeptide transport system substrate-binding subunit